MDDVKALKKILKKYLGIRMYKKEQEEFKKEFIGELFDPIEKIDYSKRTTWFINGVLEEDNLPFLFRPKVDDNGVSYWELIDLETVD